ncbi:glycosyltransferase family 61 protein [Candidatus Pelagibacter sp.]|nr:glycosyltransferase family 61 protein [Candidatus Pelagibacter sp.]
MKQNILKKLSYYAKKNYRSVRSRVFLSVYGKISVSKNPPNCKISKIKKKKELKSSNYNYNIFKIKNGRVFTDNIENVSILSNDKLLDKFSYQQVNGSIVNSRHNQVVKFGIPKFLKKFKGSIAVLAQGASGYNNYSHFLFDIIPKIKLLSEGINIKKINYFYFSKLNKYQKEIIKIIGLEKKKIIDSDKFRHVQCDQLIGVTHPNYFKGTISDAHSKMPKWIIFYLKKKLISNIKTKVSFNRIFIDRSDSKLPHCKLINNTEIKNFLISKGFKVLKLSKFNFKKQISYFENAKVIIGPHGAGFANLTFCKKNTEVIEIKPLDHPNKVYKRICKINKLKYKLIKLKKIKNNKTGDMFLNKKILNKYI